MKKACMAFSALALTAFLFVVVPHVEAEQKRVAVMWAGKASMPTEVFMGFSRKLKELASDLAVTLKRELADMQEAEKVFRELETTMNGIVFLRSSGAEFLGKADAKIPCFVGATNNPVELGVVKDMKAPEGNVTGVTYDITPEKKFEVIRTLFPSVKSVALITEKGHPGAIIDQRSTREACEKNGLKYYDVHGGTVGELVEGIQKLMGKVDLVILANNTLVLDNTTNFARATQSAKIPIFAYSERPVRNGAVAGLVARNDFLGALLAESVVDVVVKGKPIAKTPVKTDPDPQIEINEAAMKTLGIGFPAAVMEKAKIIK